MEKFLFSKSRMTRFLNFLFTIWALLTFLSVYGSEVCTISDPNELYAYTLSRVTKDSLIVLDIDDTLIVSEEPILRGHQLDSVLEKLAFCFKLDPTEALDFLEVCLDNTPYRLGRGKLVAPEWVPLIRDCFARSARVITLTKVVAGQKKIDIPNLGIQHLHNKAGEDRRFEDLEAVGLNFEKSFKCEIESDALVLSDYPFTQCSRGPPVFKKGILVTNLHDKGEVLDAFFTAINWRPSNIVLIDNIMHNVVASQRKMDELSIPFDGIHFTYVEKYLCNLNSEVLYSRLNGFLLDKKIPTTLFLQIFHDYLEKSGSTLEMNSSPLE